MVWFRAFTDATAQPALEAGVMSIEHGHLFGEATLKMMVKNGAFLSMQQLLDDKHAIQFPERSFSRKKCIGATNGNDIVYRLANKTGVKIVFGTDTLFEPALAKKQGKVLASLGHWFTPVEA